MMTKLVHKSIDIRPEVWKRLRIHAELSDVSVRDYLTYLIERSGPVSLEDAVAREALSQVSEDNRLAREFTKTQA